MAKRGISNITSTTSTGGTETTTPDIGELGRHNSRRPNERRKGPMDKAKELIGSDAFRAFGKINFEYSNDKTRLLIELIDTAERDPDLDLVDLIEKYHRSISRGNVFRLPSWKQHKIELADSLVEEIFDVEFVDCPKCKKKSAVVNTIANRSWDEALTITINCINCDAG